MTDDEDQPKFSLVSGTYRDAKRFGSGRGRLKVHYCMLSVVIVDFHKPQVIPLSPPNGPPMYYLLEPLTGV